MSTDKRRKEYGGLTEPIEMLIKQGITEKRSPQELAIEIAKALDGKSAVRIRRYINADSAGENAHHTDSRAVNDPAGIVHLPGNI